MDNQRNEYQYPTVPPVSREPPRLYVETNNDTRFSYMPAQAERLTQHGSQRVPAYTAIAPPSTLSNLPTSTSQVVQPHRAPSARQVVWVKMDDPAGESNTETAQPLHAQDYMTYTKQDKPHRPDPIKTTTPYHHSRKSIGPDENPLSPSTISHTPIWSPKSTNMTIIPPSPHTAIPTTSTYTPATSALKSLQGGTWSHSLCSCAEPTICLTSLFCPCVVYGRTQYRLSLRSARKDTSNMLGYSSINGSCVAWSFLCGINGILSGLQRGRVRRSYEMDTGSGNFFRDCLDGCCCCCCVLAQSEKEVRVREDIGRREDGGANGVPGKQEGYVPPGGMVFSPPPPQHSSKQ